MRGEFTDSMIWDPRTRGSNRSLEVLQARPAHFDEPSQAASTNTEGPVRRCVSLLVAIQGGRFVLSSNRSLFLANHSAQAIQGRTGILIPEGGMIRHNSFA